MISRLTIAAILASLLAGCSASSSPNGTSTIPGKGADTTHTGSLTFVHALDFGSVSVGASSDTSVLIENSGKDSIRILRHTLPAAPFSSLDVAAITLKAGASATLHYRFRPADTSNASAVDSIITDGTPKTYALLLTGKGYHHSVATGPTTVPNAGSMFAFSYYDIDEQGLKLDGSDWPDTNLVLATGLSTFGKPNVSRIAQSEPGAPDIPDEFLNYEANGDLSMWIDAEQTADGWTDPGWQTIPVSATSGSGPIELVLLDTVVSGVSIRYSQSYQSLGSESLTLPAGTFATVKFQYVTSIVRSDGASALDTQFVWYAPSLGMDVKSVHPYTALFQPGDVFELVAYKLR